ncbi:membrane protein [Mycobacterium Phage Sunflower1121]|nr:membrane protein [Mycobacterium Phage Sunflower1121]
MIRRIAAAAAAVLIALGASACDGDTAGDDGDGGSTGPNGVIFVPQPRMPGPGIPIFF